MKIRIISNIGSREVPLKDGDTIQDVMAAEEISGFQVVLPVCKDRQLTERLSEEVSLQKQGFGDNSTIYCKFKLKEETNMGSVSSDKTSVAKTSKRRPTNKHDVLSPMHIKPTVVTRKRSNVSSMDQLLFSPPPPKSDKRRVLETSIPQLGMRQCMDGLDDHMTGSKEEFLSPLRMKPTALRKRSKSQTSEVEESLFSPIGMSNDDTHTKKARLEFHPTPPSVCKLQDVLDVEASSS